MPLTHAASRDDAQRAQPSALVSVDPHGAGVSGCYFEYGATPSYGTSIECGFVSEIEDFPPSGTAVVPVFARIYGLSPGTTYHFRAIASNSLGVVSGADLSFAIPLFLDTGAALMGVSSSAAAWGNDSSRGIQIPSTRTYVNAHSAARRNLSCGDQREQ